MKRLMRLFLFGLICLFLWVGAATSAKAADLAWDASTGTVTGYIIYYGTVPNVFNFNQVTEDVLIYRNIDVSLSLNPNTKYYIGLRAYNQIGESIGMSNIVEYTTPAVHVDPWEPPPNTNPVPIPPVIIEVPGNVQQLIFNINPIVAPTE